MADLLLLMMLAHYALWALCWYAFVMWPVMWFRRNYRIVRRQVAHP